MFNGLLQTILFAVLVVVCLPLRATTTIYVIVTNQSLVQRRM